MVSVPCSTTKPSNSSQRDSNSLALVLVLGLGLVLMLVLVGHPAAGAPEAGEDVLRHDGGGVHAHEQQGEVQLDPKEGESGVKGNNNNSNTRKKAY